MIPDEIGQKLHDRATRGETLTAEEQEQLRHWYAHHDQEEMAQLQRRARPEPVGRPPIPGAASDRPGRRAGAAHRGA